MPECQSASAALPLLSVRDLRTHLETQHGLVRAVDGVSFDLDEGQTLGLVGESGSGKSVLARTLLGILPRKQLRQSGQMLFQGRDIAMAQEKEMRRLRGSQVAMVFQDPMTSLNPFIRIGEQIAQVVRLHFGVSARTASDRAVELLSDVGIPSPRERARAFPHMLSGGMRQRVTIAIALAGEPKLLIADEPTTALDVTVQAQILDLLQEAQEARKMALMLITHNLGIVAGRTDAIAIMYSGRIVEYGPTQAILATPRMPYTAALLRSVPRLSDKSHVRLASIPGRPPNPVAPPPGCRFAPRCDRSSGRCSQEEPAITRVGSCSFSCWHPLDEAEAQHA